MQAYEIMFILKTDLTDDMKSSEMKKIEDMVAVNGGKIVKNTDLGKKKLAYPIKKNIEGNYYLFNVEMDKTSVETLQRHFNISNNVLRGMILLQSEV